MASVWLATLCLVLTAWLPSQGQASDGPGASVKIVGGERAKNDNKFVAWIKRGDEFLCSASLYKRRWLITSASCFDPLDDDKDNHDILRAVLGDFNRANDDGEQQIKLCNIKKHPDYRRSTRRNNIAVVRLERRADFERDSIDKVPGVQFSDYDRTTLFSSECYLAGYGDVGDGSIARKRKKARIFFQDPAACGGIANYDGPNNLCYFSASSLEGIPCNKDDGSPITCKIGGKFIQVGCHSFDENTCASGNHVAVDIQKYRKFINSMIDRTNKLYTCDANVKREKGCGPEGKQFVLGFTFPDSNFPHNPPTSNPCFYVTSHESTTITLDAAPAILALLSQTTYTVDPDTGLLVCLPQDLFTDDKGKFMMTLRIHAEKDVQVFTGYEPKAIGMTSVIPLDCLKKSQTKYLVSSITGGYHNTINIMGTQDGTSVTLELPNGETIEFTLDKFDNYIKKADSISGIIVHATAPVAVYSGQACVYIPGINYCDTTYDMMPPVGSLSKSHIVPAMWPREDYIIRVVSYEDGTDIVVRKADGITIGTDTKNKGEVWDSGALDEPVVSVVCSKPCLVQQFSLGGTADQGHLGDPCSVLIPGTDRWAYHYNLYTQPTVDGDQYAAIVIPASADISGLTVNGNPVVGDFSTQMITVPTLADDYKVYYEKLLTGTVNSIKNTGPDNFMVLQYSFEFYRQTCYAPWSLKIDPAIGP